MHISQQQLDEITGLIEDSVQYFCDNERLSGELAWTVVQCLAETKLAELKGLIKA